MRGQALAEMAIILPVLLLLIFGIIEMSNAWRSYQVVTNAAREGARVAILDASSVEDVRTRVETHLEGGGVTAPATILIECVDRGTGAVASDAKCPRSGDEARVRVQVQFTFQVLGRLANLVPVTLASSSSMRKE